MKTETEILIEISGLEQQISEIKKSEFNLRRLNTQRIVQDRKSVV
jgi:hypothetical protein